MGSSTQVLLLLSAAAIACAPPASTGMTRDANVITREELAASVAVNAYAAVQNLRPAFLRSRGTNTFDPTVSPLPHVYFDGQRYGDVLALRSILINDIAEIRFLNASNATNKYGTNHTAGAIEVMSRKR